MQIDDLRQRLRALGARPIHEQAMFKAWMRGWPLDACKGDPARFFPAALRAALPALTLELDDLVRTQSEHSSADGSARLLLQVGGGQAIESVWLPRDGVCVSTQVGCAVGCVFCMTGRGGLKRQLGSAEIVAQVVLARRRRTVRRVVFMGMGEPAHNLDQTMDAIELLGTLGNIGHKNLVFSTVGDPRVFERLPHGPVKPALALSLHSTRADLRARLLPRAPRMTPVELVEAGERYARTTGYPIQYQWTLLEGVNDDDEELAGIESLLRGRYAVMNFIPFNSGEGLPFRRPSLDRARAMARHLHRCGILAKLRQSAGQDVDGGCGQLRARVLPTAASRQEA
ncbi:MAG: RNA methyltransferase [Xanthomonadales bacterium]|nr:Dual-specificity RNA methyltransferase RlmN [Xanthomonadales bacterium]MCC6594390.1 RNA methyltransferase [Xanthomonadales bacterium]MCE7932124.1 RNA methyltransferase [Xanthomonadales bacterium PRO6]